MDKITYLAELAEGLARWVPERDRRDILRYYAEYFEEAGPDREAEVMAELGDPWALSCRLAVEGGYVTHEKAAFWTPRKKWPRVLIGTAVGLSIFALVSLIGIGLLAFNVVQTVSGSTGLVFDQVLEGGSIALVEGVEFTGFYFAGDGRLEAFDSIEADISLGNIEVIAGDDFTLSIGRNNSLTGYEPTWEVRDGVLKLRDGGGSQWGRVNGWDDLKNLFDVNQWAVEVIITVPEGAALDNINVETRVGDVLLWGVNAETVTAETGVGNVECYEARSVRKLGLSTGIGDVGLILGEVGSGLDIKLESGTGNVEVSLNCLEADCAFALESGTGAVTVNGVSRGGKAERKGNTLCRLDAASGTGDVNVWFNG